MSELENEIKTGDALDTHICIIVGGLKSKLAKTEKQRDDLLEQLILIIGLLCHPGSFVNAQDIEKSKEVLSKAKE